MNTPGPGGGSSAPSSTSLTGQKLIGYGVAGGILIILADVAPRVAIGTAALMLLAVGLSHADQFTTLAGWISNATSGKAGT